MVVKIIDLTVIPSAEVGRIGKKDVVVTYQDEAGRVRVVTFPHEEIEKKPEEEQFAIISEKIKAAERERLAFVGREVKI